MVRALETYRMSAARRALRRKVRAPARISESAGEFPSPLLPRREDAGRSRAPPELPHHGFHNTEESVPMKKIATSLLVIAAIAAFAVSAASAAPLFVENFSYATPSGLESQGGWAAHSGAGTNPQTVN